MDKAAIVGVGMTAIEKNKIRDGFADMAWEAVNLALDDAGMTIDDIDNVVTTSNDFWDGRTISCMAVSDASGARDKNVSCVEGDGTFGAFYGLTRVLSGAYGTTLVTAHSKGSESISSLITNAAFEEQYCRNRPDAVLHSSLLIVINIKFAKFCFTFVFSCHFFNDRSNHAARATPYRPEIYYYRYV